MLFNSLTFAVFFILVLWIHYAPFPWTLRKINLLIASYLFYSAWNTPFVLLLFISTIADWFLARRIWDAASLRQRKFLLFLSLFVNLGLLGFFKYYHFLTDNFVYLMGRIGIHYRPLPLDIILPVGISFYTFQTLSYTLDVYFRRREPEPSFLNFALFVSFFPQLVAGPIVRANTFLPQCLRPPAFRVRQFAWGWMLIALGLFEKTVLADFFMSPIADKIFALETAPGFSESWLGTLAFSVQIFCDFAGYSTCAVGAALCLGFHLPRNFYFPYAAVGFSDFWRRWHITLSTWLRDYLYIPLGGNRLGNARTLVNLMTTMLLGGLWHGAMWTFVFWGGLHGLYLCAERKLRQSFGHLAVWSAPASKIFLALLTYALVCVAWVFFRSHRFSTAFSFTQAMLGFSRPGGTGAHLNSWESGSVLVLTALVLTLHFCFRGKKLRHIFKAVPAWAHGMIFAALAGAVLLMSGENQAFIYFQF